MPAAISQVPVKISRPAHRHPAKAVRDPMIRLGYVLEGSLVNGTATAGLGIPLEPVLAATGGVVLLVRLERGWRSARRLPIEGFALLSVLTYYAGISAGLGLAFEQYFVPTLVLGTVLSGLGVATIAGRLGELLPQQPAAAVESRSSR